MRMLKWLLRFAALAVIGAAVWHGPGLYAWLKPETRGRINVSGPQVYTRERLVNDRYREDAWLLRELNTNKSFGLTSSQTSRETYDGSATLGTPQPDARPAARDTQPAAANDDKGAATTISPFDQFNAAVTYREQIRTLMIENQLDDRHDLRGNSLYRLRFDAAVIPGNNTFASAKVTVSILPPKGMETDSLMNNDAHQEETKFASLRHLSELTGPERKVWERIYQRWLESLGRRFEEGRKAVAVAYEADRFAPSDYETLLAKMVDEIKSSYDAIVGRLTGRQMPSSVPRVSAAFLRAFSRGEDALAKTPADRLAAMKKFQDDYSKGDLEQSEDGHGAYKDQIKDLIEVVRQEKSVLEYLATSQALTLQPLTGSPAVPGTTAVVPLIDSGCGDLTTYGQYAPPPPSLRPVDYGMKYFLDRAFEDELAKFILGLQPDVSASSNPLSSVSATPSSTLNNIKALALFASVAAQYGNDGPAFTFSRQVTPLVVSDNPKCFPPSLQTVPQNVGDQTVHVSQLDLNHLKFLVPEYDLDKEVAAVVITKEWLAPVAKGTSRVVTTNIEAGLINFIRAAGRRMDAFSYAFTPSEPDEIAATQSVAEKNRSLALQPTGSVLGALGAGSVSVAAQSSVESSRTAIRKAVVAFGGQSDVATATFGWIIRPQAPVGWTGDYRQRASQVALTALISLPAWWEVIHVKIDAGWLPESGGPEERIEPPQNYTIELPVNFETVDASLFDTNDRGPVINQWATGEVIVRPCVTTEIVIPGRRLWRSTVVMLGAQKADEIFVLPDMNGIIAKFSPVAFPTTWPNVAHDYPVPLTVWTSQGSTSLPIPARFHKLEPNAPQKCPEQKQQVAEDH